MTPKIEFFYDFRSAYSYLAYTRLREMGVMKALDVRDRSYASPALPANAAQLDRRTRLNARLLAGFSEIPMGVLNGRKVDSTLCALSCAMTFPPL